MRHAAIVLLFFLVATSTWAGDDFLSTVRRIPPGVFSSKDLNASFPKPLPTMGSGRIYDVHPFFENLGISFGKGEIVLFSKTSLLLYCRVSREHLELIDDLLQPVCMGKPFRIEVSLIFAHGPKARPEYHVTATTTSGQYVKLKLTEFPKAPSPQPTRVEIVVGPDGITYDYTIQGSVALTGMTAPVEAHGTARLGSFVQVPLGQLASQIQGTPVLLLRAIHPEDKADIEASAWWRAAKAQAVEEDLAR